MNEKQTIKDNTKYLQKIKGAMTYTIEFVPNLDFLITRLLMPPPNVIQFMWYILAAFTLENRCI